MTSYDQAVFHKIFKERVREAAQTMEAAGQVIDLEACKLSVGRAILQNGLLCIQDVVQQALKLYWMGIITWDEYEAFRQKGNKAIKAVKTALADLGFHKTDGATA